MVHKVLIDCDNTMGLPGWEVDDGLVILYLLGRDDIEVVGITNTFGNGSLRDVERYTADLLEEISRTDIPRYGGEAFDNQNPGLVLDIRAGDRYKNELPAPPFPSDAATFLLNAVNESPGEITILALGPMGNLYDAWRLDHTFYSRVKEIVLMGGYTGELILGTTPCRELNLSCNPPAAYSVLHAECPVVVFNGHICLQAPFTRDDLRRLDMWPASRRSVVSAWLDGFTSHFGDDRFYLWDLLPAVYVSYPELFDLKNVAVSPTVESLEQGQLVPTGDSGTTTIVMPDNIVDQTLFMEVLEAGWKSEWARESAGWPGVGM